MSENSTPEERTEMPTDRRMDRLRKDGQIFHSHELVQILTLAVAFYALEFLWSWMFDTFKLVFVGSFKMITTAHELTLERLHSGMIDLLKLIGPFMLVLIGVISTVAVLAVMLQTNWNVKEKKIEFKWSFLNPIEGIKRIISVHGVVTTLKAIFKLCLILPIGYFGLKAFAPHMIELIHTNVASILAYTGDAMKTLFWQVMYVLFAMAVFDIVWGKYQWLKKNKMTKDEVKDERKSIEGDESTRKRIIAKGLQRIMQRIMQSVPKADVVIRNPTHFAVALKYERGKMSAPVVVAKGKGFLALRIIEIAEAAGVPVLTRKPLARALFAATEVGSEIPNELFKAVAEVLAYVYRLKGPRAFSNANQVN